MRRSLLLALLALVVVAVTAAACGPQTFEVVIAQPTIAPSPSPTAFAGIPLYGTGSDGTLVVSTGEAKTVNTCHQLVDLINSTSLDLSSTSGFADDQVLLLLQERDRTTVTPPGNAGRFELVRLATVSGPATALTRFPILYNYESAAGSKAQACSVPEFLTVEVLTGGTILAAPRDLVAGGVLAFLVSSSLGIDLGGVLAAEGSGFPGGPCDGNTETDISDAPDDSQGGSKGEGFLGSGEGRGRRANGGGGGNPFQAGGGGGGGARAGGRGGGAPTSEDKAFGEGGEGIAGLSSGARLFFGGGGGGAHSASGEAPPCDGAGGGGVIFVQAREAHGTGGHVEAPGAAINELGSITSGGGGGGGGGGTVWLIVGTGGNFHPEHVVVSGGKGGNTFDNIPEAAGPGGGGGGGFARVGGVTDYDLILDGGQPGLIDGLGTDESRGATMGSSGTIF